MLTVILMVFPAMFVVGFAMMLTKIPYDLSSNRNHEDDDGEHGGGGKSPQPAPRGPSPVPDDPPWWAAFERDLSDWITASTSDRHRQPAAAEPVRSDVCTPDDERSAFATRPGMKIVGSYPNKGGGD